MFVQTARDAERGTPYGRAWIKSRRALWRIRPYFPLKICLNKYTSLRMVDEVRRAAQRELVTAFRNYRACGNKPIRRFCRTRVRGFHKKSSDYRGFFEPVAIDRESARTILFAKPWPRSLPHVDCNARLYLFNRPRRAPGSARCQCPLQFASMK